ncbi:uncharacterized protein GGS22DRAFT_148716 [Annulohypoxylon maeteangense]|uniref:uncharacterized protein n=1 Tax=Annulohypoxylon maeteangense TaxID=1927788 RepID=UPI0020077BC4|nr:uncharacterized protein GGS22DRAFT_148716 [Annulohypoxylon maeteangense]KAI0889607.1 hypothetical protein GGS22DRAFT_148716 [Annulohypoxylon maeteangense]
MVSQNVVALLGLASTAAATYRPQALGSLNNLRAERIVIEVREAQTSSPSNALSSACASSADALITDVPIPPSSLESYFASFARTANFSDDVSYLCSITASVPASLTAAYSSYDQQASSWFVKHSSDLTAIVSQCGTQEDVNSIAQVVTALDIYLASGCGTRSTGLAARPTGAIAGAVAAAGVLGAAVVL